MHEMLITIGPWLPWLVFAALTALAIGVTVIAGEDTANIETAQRKVDMSEAILGLWPDETPFTVLLRKLAKKKTVNPVFDWLEDEPRPWVDQVNNAAGYLATDTAIVVDNGTYWRAGDTLLVFRTRERMRVTAVATNTLTVVRSLGATAAAALVDNDFFFIMGSQYAEGAAKGTARHTKKVKKTNYTQIFRSPIKITGTLQASALYGGDERGYQRAKQGKEHNMQLERAFWFGEKNEDLAGATPLRSTGGVLEFITTNKTTLANDAALTQAAFDAFWEGVFYYGSSHRWAFASPHMMTLINAFALGKLQLWQQNVGPTGTTFGVSVARYISPHGIVDLVMHKLLKDYRSATGDIAGKALFALDFDLEDGVAYRFLQTRETALIPDIQAKGDDAVEDEYLTECGLQFGQERRSGILDING